LSRARYDVCIVGGGIVGLSAAYYLLKNDYKVVLLEKANRLGSEASSSNGGTTLPFNQMLNEPFLYELVRDGMQAHWGLVDSGLKYDFRKIGCLYPFYKEEERLDMERRLEAIQGNEKYISLSKDQVGEAEPEFRKDVVGGMLFPDCTHGESYKFCKELEIANKSRGLVAMTSSEVTSFKKEPRRILSAVVDGSEIVADYFVLANGPWCNQFSDALGFGIPTIPILGHMITWTPDKKVMSNVIWTGRGVLLPGDGNEVRMGGGMDYTGYDKSPKDRTVDILSSSAVKAIPSFESINRSVCISLATIVVEIFLPRATLKPLDIIFYKRSGTGLL